MLSSLRNRGGNQSAAALVSKSPFVYNRVSKKVKLETRKLSVLVHWSKLVTNFQNYGQTYQVLLRFPFSILYGKLHSWGGSCQQLCQYVHLQMSIKRDQTFQPGCMMNPYVVGNTLSYVRTAACACEHEFWWRAEFSLVTRPSTWRASFSVCSHVWREGNLWTIISMGVPQR